VANTKKPIICLTGNNFSGKFLECWTDLLMYCAAQEDLDITVARSESCNIYHARNFSLGGRVLNGKSQKPFNGQIDYTHIVWIDNDIVFQPAQFRKLLEHDKDVVAGVYKYNAAFGGLYTGNLKLACGWFDAGFPTQTLSCTSLTEERSKSYFSPLIEVDWTGFGFISVKKGVFEQIEYPWFEPLSFRLREEEFQLTDDLAVCWKIKKAGFKIHINRDIQVGHEKRTIV